MCAAFRPPDNQLFNSALARNDTCHIEGTTARHGPPDMENQRQPIRGKHSRNAASPVSTDFNAILHDGSVRCCSCRWKFQTKFSQHLCSLRSHLAKIQL